jgi:RimJ/RimL family protein N-acetyltransferase
MDLILTTPRLRLSPQTRGDVATLQAFFRQPGVRRFLLDDQLVDEAWVAATVAQSEANFAREGWGLWIARERTNKTLLGVTGLLRMNGEDAEPELLYALDDRRRGRGFATEMAEAVLAHAFGACGLVRVLASTDAPNHDSLSVMDRLGMTPISAPTPGKGADHPYRALSFENWVRTRTIRLAAIQPS